MEVLIIENDSGKVVAQYTINIGGQNYTPTDEEHFSQAWQCAVDDNVVENDNREKYTLNFGS